MKLFSAQTRLILLVTAFIMATGNLSLFRRLLEIYPPTGNNLLFLLALTVFFTFGTALFFLWVCHGRAGKWVLAVYLIASALAAFYMDQYGIVIDFVMIDNIVETNPQELAGLISMSLVLRLLAFGVIPAFLVLKFGRHIRGFCGELKSKLLLGLGLILAMVLVIAPFTAQFASFVREHKVTRLYANPLGFTNALVSYAQHHLQSSKSYTLINVAEDAKEVGAPSHNELIILVVGETARADRFSLNGYHKETNPELKKQNVVSFRNVASCGTSTGESVPCMFSVLGRKDFDREKALHYKNALDVLFEHGVQILWRDNNSDSKGVATRMTYENFKSPSVNPVCDEECRDIGMLSGLDKYIETRKHKDILIVLHQMGNHGPEYYRRYPKEFARFQPMCMSGELNTCSKEEIDNAYDNAILYTDYFLSNVIELLKKYDDQFATAMLYLSDHGESLGEHGIYLHAAPYVIAPKEQTHIPAILWTGKHFDYDVADIRPFENYPLSHDDLFCSLMIAYELKSHTCSSKDALLFKNKDVGPIVH
jgi:lipid A ethanolaminephosphotransferase